MDKIQKIKDLIESKNSSYDKLAKSLGKTTQTIANYLTGRTKIDVDTLENIAKVFEVPISYFFDGNTAVELPKKQAVKNADSAEVEVLILRNKVETMQKEIDNLQARLKDKEKIISMLEDK